MVGPVAWWLRKKAMKRKVTKDKLRRAARTGGAVPVEYIEPGSITMDYDFTHGSQDAPCMKCDKRLGDHPLAKEILSYQDMPFLHRDCTGRLWKL